MYLKMSIQTHIDNTYSIEATQYVDTCERLEISNSPSYIKRRKMAKVCISNIEQDPIKQEQLVSALSALYIQAGSKGNIRGKAFNKFIKKTIIEMNIPVYCTVEFEMNCPSIETDEIPDWYIHNTLNDKILIGMNQVSLWGGGH